MSRFAVFKKVKEIKSQKGALHFVRYALVETPWFALYIHRIHKADADPHLHNHPWSFFNIILRGAYIEQNDDGLRLREPFDVAQADRNYFHKIEHIVDGPVTTLMAVGRRHEDWFYLVNGERIRFDAYRERKNAEK